MENKWILRILALGLTLIMFFSINQNAQNYVTNSLFSTKQTQVIKNVPVKLIYDKDNLYVIGVPETVDVTISGPNSLVKKEVSQRNLVAVLDLSEVEIGKDIKVIPKISGLAESITSSISPKEVVVSLDKKETATFNVEYVINDSRFADGYELQNTKINPQQVVISGPSKEMKRIAYVKATTLPVTKLTHTTTETAIVEAYDNNLNKIEDIDIETKGVDITMNIIPIEKEIPLVLKPLGNVKANYTLEGMIPSQSTIRIRAKTHAELDEITQLEVPVEINELDKTTVKKVRLVTPEQAVGLSREEINVEIKIKPVTSR